MWRLQSSVIMIVLTAVLSCASAWTTDTTSVWLAMLKSSREQLLTVADDGRRQEVARLWRHLERSFPVYSDWLLQDAFEEGLWTHAPAGGRERFRVQGELIGDLLAELLLGLNTAQWQSMLLRVMGELSHADYEAAWLLDAHHNETRLSREELEAIACWIDLAVPYCGDYTEANAWNEEEQAKYAHFLRKRRDMEAVEAQHIEAYIQDRQQR